MSAWDEPERGLRLVYLAFGLVIAYILVPYAFGQLGVTGGVSYLFALFCAVSNATFFRMVRVNKVQYVPLALVAPFAIIVGIVGSAAIRPLIGDAKNVALAQDFAGALIILGVFAFLTLWFRRLQSGNPYG